MFKSEHMLKRKGQGHGRINRIAGALSQHHRRFLESERWKTANAPRTDESFTTKKH